MSVISVAYRVGYLASGCTTDEDVFPSPAPTDWIYILRVARAYESRPQYVDGFNLVQVLSNNYSSCESM